jgi:ATP-dependent DNA helicase RecG
MHSTNDSITQLKGVGKALQLKLNKLNIFNINDLLFHLPFRYEDRTQLISIDQLRPLQSVLVQGEVISNTVMTGRRQSLLIRINDGTRTLGLRFYYVSAALQRQYPTGKLVRVFGEARPAATGLEIYHPEIEVIQSYDQPLDNTLTAVYGTTDGLTQNQLRKLMVQALEQIHQSPPANLLETCQLPVQLNYELVDALDVVHHPKSNDITALLAGNHPAQQRLSLEELIAHNVFLRLTRTVQHQEQAVQALPESQSVTRLLQALPFQLTHAQTRVINELHQDMRSKDNSQQKAMSRLVQGDVGAGKTLVAIIAMLHMVDVGKQAVMMAPTEILAQQHYENASKLLEPLGINVGLLLGRLTAKQKTAMQEKIAAGKIDIIIGTHAVFQENVSYANLAIVVIDEQHRFGVEQRLALLEKGKQKGLMPHQIVMTATPIPRTLSMTMYADLDSSIIDELPPGRKPIQTSVINNERRAQVIARVHQACLEGKQVYWVNTLIEENEELALEAAEKTQAELQVQLFDLKIGLVHGKQKGKDKQAQMQAFKQGELHILVATTVIEVGVDVPNASVMVIENSERLGLSQLHQLRGRVGRGQLDSFCLLMYQAPLAAHSKERLKVLRDSNDGFLIAEKDLELRGPGEFMGTRQTGDQAFLIADIVRDQKLAELANQLSQQLVEQTNQSSANYAKALIARWLANKRDYSKT